MLHALRKSALTPKQSPPSCTLSEYDFPNVPFPYVVPCPDSAACSAAMLAATHASWHAMDRSTSVGLLPQPGVSVGFTQLTPACPWNAWSMDNLLASTGDNYCEARSSFHGAFNAKARALYQEIQLVNATAEMNLRQNPKGSGKVTVSILDETVAVSDPDDTVDPTSFSVVTATSQVDKEFFGVGATFTVVIIPVTIRGGAAGKVGATATLMGGMPEGQKDCGPGNLLVSSVFTPFAEVDAFATASVDAIIIEVGVKVTLTLLRLELPLTATVQLTPDPGHQGAKMAMDVNLDLVLSTLSGSFALFVKVCYIVACSEYDATIFDWDGPHTRMNLYSKQASLNLGAVLAWLETQP